MATLIKETLGKRVKMLRDHQGLTQDELRAEVMRATGMHISQNYISEIERDKAVPNANLVAALAQYFRVTADFLLLISDNPSIPDNDRHLIVEIESIHQRRIAEEAVELLLELPEDEQEHMLKTIRLLRGSRRPRIIGSES